jgi:hypothetical protein
MIYKMSSEKALMVLSGESPRDDQVADLSGYPERFEIC